MADNTQLNPGTGGDLILTEQPGGSGPKIPVSKIRLGAADVDGGDVTGTNPLPVQVTGPALLNSRTASGSNTGVIIKASPGVVKSWFMANLDATHNAFLKLYDKPTVPTSADSPLYVGNVGPTQQFGMSIPEGLPFATGISVRFTTGAADNDNTAPTAGAITADILYS